MRAISRSSCATRSNREKRSHASLRAKLRRWLRMCSCTRATRRLASRREFDPRRLRASDRWRRASTSSDARKKRGFSTRSPVLSVANTSRPTSTPTVDRTGIFVSASPRSQTNETYQPCAERPMRTNFTVPRSSRYLWNFTIPSLGTFRRSPSTRGIHDPSSKLLYRSRDRKRGYPGVCPSFTRRKNDLNDRSIRVNALRSTSTGIAAHSGSEARSSVSSFC